MRIRAEQIAVFERASQAERERRLLAGVLQEFPHLRLWHSAPALTALVRLALEKSARHGLDAAADVQRYLNLMALLGSHWELDPQAGWAAGAVAPHEDTSASQRIEQLWAQAQVWRERVHGPQDALYLEALRSFCGASVEALCMNPSRSQRDLLLQLAQLYPRKYSEVGEQALCELTRLAVEACKPYQLLDRWAVVLVAQLMFLLGAGFLGDPLHAWASEALNASAGESVDRRLALLFAAAVDGMKGSEAGVEPSAKTR